MQLFIDTYGHLLSLLGLLSTATFFLSLLIIPWIIGMLDKDFFIHLHEHKKKEDEHPVIFILLRTLRYFLGFILFLSGILMLFLPGQGILTIILGISLLDFPGKRALTDRLLSYRPVQKGLNWIRKKENKPEFSFVSLR
ncbi:Putative transmembrane protein (PGPGW) [Desulfocapsa sulfexigens DSM 10523]|uniref:Putative transmembrane protein (PGPGW) n=1 Tax=Desulfocapsa sulfexigens (strain DSM 10523 / SB164P1) TaxID=1167006 RepID=M1PGL2_DESSD|nr:PGPGW domain-containing protein [Desulfocapsa sulfexigens]AGF78785.1 Putative transmembrane protein (PGPGW) [Desulfocapsa sulfexigens DSM 10523]